MCGFHAPGRFDQILPLTDCMLASERSNAAREQVARRAAPAGPRRLGPPHAAGLPAQPRRPRGPPHRPAPGPPRHLARQARRRRADRGGRRRGPAVDPDRGARREHAGRRDDAALRRAAAARAARRPALPDLAGGVLPDQHGDGRGALRPRRRGRRACTAASASSTSTAGSARSASRSPRGRARSSASSSSRPPCPTRSRTPSSTRSPTPPSSPATSAWRCASSSSGPAGPTSRHRPAARRPVAEGRAPHHRGLAAADRLRLLQPDDARAQRRAARRGGLDPQAPCSPSTCSPRPRTSSAWPCSRRREPHPRLALRLRQRLPRRGGGRADAGRHRDPRQREGDPGGGRASSAARSCGSR